ncbi:hypothetical protein Tco_0833052 [Tanacetum coccineum]
MPLLKQVAICVQSNEYNMHMDNPYKPVLIHTILVDFDFDEARRVVDFDVDKARRVVNFDVEKARRVVDSDVVQVRPSTLLNVYSLDLQCQMHPSAFF